MCVNKVKGQEMEHRTGENGVLPFRTNRIFNVGGAWFFAVRDGKDCGPFENMQDAKNMLSQYLSEMASLETL